MKKQGFSIFAFLIIVLFSGNSCGQVLSKTKYFRIEAAEKRVFYPGIMGAPINTTFTFKIIARKCFDFSADSFWADGMADKVQIAYNSNKLFNGNVMKGDTLLITCTWLKSTAQEGYTPDFVGLNSSTESVAKMPHAGKLLFRYNINKKRNLFYSIKEIKEIESVYAP